jgi:hypothetical protein
MKAKVRENCNDTKIGEQHFDLFFLWMMTAFTAYVSGIISSFY